MKRLCAGVLCMCALAGCGRAQQAKLRELEASNLKPLGVFYGRFIGQHGGQPPASEAELKAFVKSLGKDELATFGISDAESLFISPRDGKPYVILCRPAKGPPGPAGSPVIAYEQEGRGGKRQVVSAVGAVEEVDQARFEELVPAGSAAGETKRGR